MKSSVSCLPTVLLVACMHTVESVERSTVPQPPDVSPPVAELRLTMTRWEEEPEGAALIVETQDGCYQRARQRVVRKRVTESKASDVRWIAVGLAATASLLSLRAAGDELDETKAYTSACVYAGGAVAIAVVPWLLESEQSEPLAGEVELSSEVVARCGRPKPVRAAEVVVRAKGRERSAVTNAQGRAFFEALSSAEVDVVLVDGLAVTPPFNPSKPAPTR